MLYTAENGSHIFLASIFLKQGISSEYVMVAWANSESRGENRELQNENF